MVIAAGVKKCRRKFFKKTNAVRLGELGISPGQTAGSLGLDSGALPGLLQHWLDRVRHLAFELIGEVMQDAHAIL